MLIRGCLYGLGSTGQAELYFNSGTATTNSGTLLVNGLGAEVQSRPHAEQSYREKPGTQTKTRVCLRLCFFVALTLRKIFALLRGCCRAYSFIFLFCSRL